MSVRRSNLPAPSNNIGATTLREQFRPKGDTFWERLVWGPNDHIAMSWTMGLKSVLMEFLRALFLYFFVQMTRSIVGATAGAATLLNGVVVGLVGAIVVLMTTKWRRNDHSSDYELPAMLTPSITAGHMLVMRIGLIYGVLYMIAQLAGAAAAAGLLTVFAPAGPAFLNTVPGIGAVLPFAFASTGRMWAVELIATTAIVFAALYNTYLGPDVDSETTNKVQQAGNTHHAFMRFAFTAVFWPFGGYTFDGFLYVTGYWAMQMTGVPPQSPWWFHIFAPAIGVAIAVLLYVLVLAIHGAKTPVKTRPRPMQGPELEEPLLREQVRMTDVSGSNGKRQ